MAAGSAQELEAAVEHARAAAATRGLGAPDALLLLATGKDRLVSALADPLDVPLGDLDGVPVPWAGGTLTAGSLHGRAVWLLEDDPVPLGPGDAPWTRAFPVWWAAAAGAAALVHASAGTALAADGGPGPGTLAVVEDHINLSGSSPLTGLGDSRLGPLFPDQTRLHDDRFAELAREVASARGLRLGTAVAACTLGPALSTPAELRWYRAAGAHVAIQGLAAPLIAAAHAGLPTLALCAVTDHAGDDPSSVARLVEASAALAPDLDALLAAVTEGLARVDTR